MTAGVCADIALQGNLGHILRVTWVVQWYSSSSPKRRMEWPPAMSMTGV